MEVEKEELKQTKNCSQDITEYGIMDFETGNKPEFNK